MATKKSILALLLSACLLGACLGGGIAAAAKQPTHHAKHGTKTKRKQPTGDVYWGAWIGDQLTGGEAPWDMSAVTAFERLVGKSPSLVEFSSPFRSCEEGSCQPNRFPAAPMQSIRNYGAIPVFSWGSQPNSATLESNEFKLASIAHGAFDSYLREFAAEAKRWGNPFFLRFDWEMNGNWFLWSEGLNGNMPGDYIAAWRHVHDIFEEVGASNATWVWCPYAGATGRRADLSRYYPGDHYVDWTCLDGYNWGKGSIHPTPWRSFDTLFASSYNQVAKEIAPHKPLMLGEFASNGGGKPKALWIQRMFEALPKRYPKVHGLVWFDRLDRGMSWNLESSPAGAKAFSRGIRDRRYRGPAFSALTQSPIPVPR